MAVQQMTMWAGAVEACATSTFVVATRGCGLTEITGDVAAFVAASGVREGVLTAFCRHTSASLTIQENADPDVGLDLIAALDRLAPESAGWIHDSEGPDDMPAHVKAMLTGVSLSIPIHRGALALGAWQGIYLIEHRARPHRRELVLCALGGG